MSMLVGGESGLKCRGAEDGGAGDGHTRRVGGSGAIGERRVGSVGGVDDSGSGGVGGDADGEGGGVESAIDIKGGVRHESAGGRSIGFTGCGRRKITRRSVGNVGSLGRVVELVDHRAAIGIDEGEVSAACGDFEVAMQLGKSTACASGEDDEVGISVERNASGEGPLGEVSGVAGEMKAVEVDGEGVGIVDFDPVREVAIFIGEVAVVASEKFVESGREDGNIDAHRHSGSDRSAAVACGEKVGRGSGWADDKAARGGIDGADAVVDFGGVGSGDLPIQRGGFSTGDECRSGGEGGDFRQGESAANLVAVDMDISESVGDEADRLAGAVGDKSADRELSKSARRARGGYIDGVAFSVAKSHDASGGAGSQIGEEDLNRVDLSNDQRPSAYGDGGRSSASKFHVVEECVEAGIESCLTTQGKSSGSVGQESI